MRTLIRHFLLLCCTVLCVVGCSTAPSSQTSSSALSRDQMFDRNQDKLSNLKSWQFDGRFSIRSSHGVDTANLSWLQESARYLIKISGPLQQGTVFIRGDQATISYKDSKGITDHASTPEELLTRHTQYQLPISSLRYWVMGRPDPRFAFHLNISANGDLRTLTQQGWEIRYEGFNTIEPYRLPTKIIMKHEKLDITVSIHDWHPDLVAE